MVSNVLHILSFVFKGPYDVVVLPGGMPGAKNLAEVRNTDACLFVLLFPFQRVFKVETLLTLAFFP